jgi:hypothetical protein
MIDRGSLSPDHLRTANGGRPKNISLMSKSYQLKTFRAPWRHSRSLFTSTLDTIPSFIDELYTPVGYELNIPYRGIEYKL